LWKRQGTELVTLKQIQQSEQTAGYKFAVLFRYIIMASGRLLARKHIFYQGLEKIGFAFALKQ
jgi:hypothetical protein